MCSHCVDVSKASEDDEKDNSEDHNEGEEDKAEKKEEHAIDEEKKEGKAWLGQYEGIPNRPILCYKHSHM